MNFECVVTVGQSWDCGVTLPTAPGCNSQSAGGSIFKMQDTFYLADRDGRRAVQFAGTLRPDNVDWLKESSVASIFGARDCIFYVVFR